MLPGKRIHAPHIPGLLAGDTEMQSSVASGKGCPAAHASVEPVRAAGGKGFSGHPCIPGTAGGLKGTAHPGVRRSL